MSENNSIMSNSKSFTIDEEMFVASLTFHSDWLDGRGSVIDSIDWTSLSEEIKDYEEISKEYRKKNKWSMFSMLYYYL